MSNDPTALLVEALHKYLDDGGDPDAMLDMARMVAQERADEFDEAFNGPEA
jgi:hypothetical protein